MSEQSGLCFIERVAEWYLEGTLQDELDDLLAECAHKVSTDAEEQTHENIIYFKRFEEALERNLAAFCKLEDITEVEFYKQCEEESASSKVCITILSNIFNQFHSKRIINNSKRAAC
eukprot:TRINITY_DN6885_c0_g1_i1.p1 TRINITY_DN6885_c0_g1~~TRINITY_DN6885_c0_g1_i1.p1  ORF type:complete len:117 (+),score=30.19 TRINITY_DN6885_c0_g1_i1:50-400(+)